MGILQRATELLARHDVIAHTIPVWEASRERGAAQDFEELAKRGYCRNVVLYAATNEIAKSAGEPELVAEKRVSANEWKRVRSAHRLARLAENPNPEQSSFEFIEATVSPLSIGGEALTHKPRNTAQEIVELWPLRPDRLKVLTGPDGFISGYRYKVPGAQARNVSAADVSHLKRYHPLNDYRGFSPFAVVASETELDNHAIKYLESFFLNAAVPFGLLKVKANAKRGSREALQAEMEEKYGFNNPGIGGILRRNWHRFMVIGSEADFQQLGSNLDQLKLDGVFSETESRLCVALGVPPLLVGVWIGLMRSTYSNYIAMMRDFWERTLIPMYRRIETKLTTDVAHEWGPDFRFRFDLSTVKALQESTKDLRQLGINGWNSGLLSRDEGRLKLGESAIDGDVRVFKQATNALYVTKDGELQKEAVAEFNRARQAMIDGLERGEVRLVPELTSSPAPAEEGERTRLAEVLEKHERIMICGAPGAGTAELVAEVTDREKLGAGVEGRGGDTPPTIGPVETAYYWAERLQSHGGPWLLEGAAVARVLLASLRDYGFEPDAVIMLHGGDEEPPDDESGQGQGDDEHGARRPSSHEKAWRKYLAVREERGSEVPIFEGVSADFLAPIEEVEA